MTANEVFEVIDLKRKNQSLRSQLEKAEKLLKEISELPNVVNYSLATTSIINKYFEEKKDLTTNE